MNTLTAATQLAWELTKALGRAMLVGNLSAEDAR